MWTPPHGGYTFENFRCSQDTFMASPPGGFPLSSNPETPGAPLAYFDHAATTPLDPAAREAMEPFFTRVFGNPSSPHGTGREARAALDRSRRTLAEILGADPREIVFTSGGTESLNLALKGAAFALRAKGSHLVVSAVEHKASLEAVEWLKRQGFQATAVGVGPTGIVDPGEVARAMRPETVLVSVMAANNETGALQPIRECAEVARRAGAVFHTDAVQAFGKVPLPPAAECADLLSGSAHKFGGPKGAGFLFVRRGTDLAPWIHGGGQERGRRGGTENTAACVGMAEAAAQRARSMDAEAARLRSLEEILLSGVRRRLPGIVLNGPEDPALRVPGLLNLTVPGLDGETLVHALDRKGFAVSTGAACSTGAAESSHVLAAMGRSGAAACGGLRISLGAGNTEAEVRQFVEVLAIIADRLAAMASLWGEEDGAAAGRRKPGRGG